MFSYSKPSFSHSRTLVGNDKLSTRLARPRGSNFCSMWLCSVTVALAWAPFVAKADLINLSSINDGGTVAGSLVLSGNELYGVTSAGTIFKVATNGTGLTTMAVVGGYPSGGLVLGGSTLYGVTQEGGSGYGSIYKIGINGTSVTTMSSFGSYPGGVAYPMGGLALSGSTLYGMTSQGAYNSLTTYYAGTIFSIATSASGGSNTPTVRYQFMGSGNPDGGLLISGSTLYGMTSNAGNGYGSVFSVATNGTNFNTLHAFTDTYTGTLPNNMSVFVGDGMSPTGDLILVGTTLYGMALWGGANGYGDIFSVSTTGTNFKVLHDFTGADGAYPWGSLTYANGVLFGMTSGDYDSYSGTGDNSGTIFSINLDGTGFHNMHVFANSENAQPHGNLTYGGTGTALYGAYGDAEIFSIPTSDVPEPASLTLVVLGALALLRRRRVA